MKIGINASFIRKPGTGIGQVSLNFLKELFEIEDKSQNEFVLYFEELPPKDFAVPKNFEIRAFLPLWKRDDLIRKIWWEKYSLPKKAKKDNCDLFFSLYQCPTVLPKKIPHLMLVHDLIPRFFPEYLNNSRKKNYQKLTEKAIKKATRLISVSKRTEKDLIQELGIAGEKITTNYIATDPIYQKKPTSEKISEVLTKYHLKPGYILGGAGLDKRKNIRGLILAYKKLIERNKQEKFLSQIPPLVIIGKLNPKLAPLMTDVEKLIKKNNLIGKVKTLGFVPQKEMPAVYNQASLFVYPSFYEGFGLPVLEAMSQGVPVLTSKTSSLPEVGKDGVLYCNPEDTEEISHIMKKILIQENLRQDLKRKGQERSEEFSWKKFLKKILTIISTFQISEK